MATFEYKAKDTKGRIIEDVIESPSRKEAAALLHDQGYQVLMVHEIKPSQSFFDRIRKVSTIEKAIFCRYLATMMKAGLPLAEAVEIIAKESSNPKMHRILRDIQYSLQRGQKLSSIFARYPEVFDQVFLTMTRAGEESGTLEQSFDYLSKQLLNSYELGQKVKGALLYPAVIIAAMIGVGVLMVTFVLPRISKVFLRLNIKLPLATKLLLQTSDFLSKNYPVVLACLVILLLTTFFLVRLSRTRRFLIGIMGRLPLVSQLFTQLDLARFSRTLATLLKSGVPIIESMRASIPLLTQPRFLRLGKNFEEEIQKGKPLSEAIEKGEGTFPALMIQSIRAGERSGSLEVVLAELADFYEQEVEHTLKSLTAVLEPVIMLVIGAAVGAMVIAIIAPIYGVIGSLQPQGPKF